MKKNYNTKKKVLIGGLSLVAVCLIVGLFYFSSAADRQAKAPATSSSTPSESEVVVPETSQPEATLPEESGTTSKEVVSSTRPETASAPASSAAQSKPSDGKPKTRSDATPPATAPDKSNEKSSKGSTKQSQPQGGEQKSGKVYVPGFGWIEDEGGGSTVHEAPNAGTGDPIGDM